MRPCRSGTHKPPACRRLPAPQRSIARSRRTRSRDRDRRGARQDRGCDEASAGRDRGATRMSRAPPQRHWRSYGNDPLPDRRRGARRTVRRVPLMVHARRLRALRAGAHVQRGARQRRAARHADPRPPRQDASRGLRRTGGEGGAAQRRRGRQQPAGASDPAAGGPLTFTLDKLAHAMRGMPRDARIMIQLPGGKLSWSSRWSGRCIPARTATTRPFRPRPAGVTPSFWSRKAGARRADRPCARSCCWASQQAPHLAASAHRGSGTPSQRRW